MGVFYFLTYFCVDSNKKKFKRYLEPLKMRRIYISGISCRWGPPARNHCAELFSRYSPLPQPPAKKISQIPWVFQVRPQLCSGWPCGESHPLSCLRLPSCETGTCGKAPGGSSTHFSLCLVAHPCPALCDRMDCSPPGSSVHGIFQARILEWVVISSSRESS